MSRNFSPEKIIMSRIDYIFLVILITLMGLGVAMLFSASWDYGEKRFGDSFFFFSKQLMWMGLGGVLAGLVMFIPVNLIKAGIPILIVSSLVLCLMTFIPAFNIEAHGAHRWISIGNFSFQPSELVKLTIILYLAHMLSKNEQKLHDVPNSVLPPLIVVGLFVMIIYLQNDFSTAVFVGFIAFFMFFISGIKLRYFIGFGLASAVTMLILLFTRPHRVKRLVSFLDPEIDPAGTGYQIIGSLSALSRGGLWGTGLGQSIKKNGAVPEAQSDFIFSIIGEEAGFIGVLFVIGLFVMFACRGYMIAWHQHGKFEFYAAFGITSSILYQAFLNMAVVSDSVPATGVPLPFFSSGGSALVTTMIMCGLLLNMSRRMNIHSGDHHG